MLSLYGSNGVTTLLNKCLMFLLASGYTDNTDICTAVHKAWICHIPDHGVLFNVDVTSFSRTMHI